MNMFYFKVFIIVTLFVLAIIVVKAVIDKNTKNTFSFDEILEGVSPDKKKKEKLGGIKLFAIENFIFTILKIKKPSKAIIIIERLVVVAIGLTMAYLFNFLAIFFVFEVFMWFKTKNKEKEVEDANNLTSIPKTNAFLDMYIPAHNNGESVNKIMNRFVEQEKDPELTKWWFSEDRESEEPPLFWRDVIKIYNNGLYNEQNGFEDSSEVYQRDIMTQQTYYNHFKEKIGEIAPIRGCYYMFMPVVCMISWINDKEFWGSMFGLLDVAIMCGLMFIFTTLLGKLHKDTCEKLF